MWKIFLSPCFNTQPPEGGCSHKNDFPLSYRRFNTQPPEGGCKISNVYHGTRFSFNTQPPEGGCINKIITNTTPKSFNTQPPEGGCRGFTPQTAADTKFQHTAARRRLPPPTKRLHLIQPVSTHSRPKAAARIRERDADGIKFQHTAARRRLRLLEIYFNRGGWNVSTHSRPKAAAFSVRHY